VCRIKIALRRSFFEKNSAEYSKKGTDKGGSFVTVVRLETKLRATLTEQQKAMLEQLIDRFEKTLLMFLLIPLNLITVI
jgi:hypothetical protein